MQRQEELATLLSKNPLGTTDSKYPADAETGAIDKFGRIAMADQSEQSLKELGAWLRQHEQEHKDGSVGGQAPLQSPGGSVLL